MTATLDMDELAPLFRALRNEEPEPLPEALAQIVQLARHKGMDAPALEQVLNSYNIETTAEFSTWLEKEFGKIV